MKTIALFNNKGGVGKTSLLYHLAHMFALRGRRVVAADLDPQANLSGMFLQDDRIEALWRQSRENYGRPRIQVDLQDEGIRASDKRVARLMRDVNAGRKLTHIACESPV